MRARSFAKLFSCAVLAAASIGTSVAAPPGDAAARHAVVVVGTVSDATGFPAHAIAHPLRAAAASHLGAAAVSAQMDAGSAALVATPGVAAAADETADQGSPEDYLLLTLVGLGLIAYQLLRKHRLLRPQPFSL